MRLGRDSFQPPSGPCGHTTIAEGAPAGGGGWASSTHAPSWAYTPPAVSPGEPKEKGWVEGLDRRSLLLVGAFAEK